MKLVPSFDHAHDGDLFPLHRSACPTLFPGCRKAIGAVKLDPGRNIGARVELSGRENTGVETDGLYGHLFGQYAIHAVVLQQVVPVKCWNLSAGGTRCHRAVPNVLSPSPPLRICHRPCLIFPEEDNRSAAVIPFVDIDGIAAQALNLVLDIALQAVHRGQYPMIQKMPKATPVRPKRQTEFIHS